MVRKLNDYRFVWKDKIFTIGGGRPVEITAERHMEELMSAADSACYVAKRHNGHMGNHVHVYSARDEAVARQRGEIQWLQRLQVALKEHQFELLAQPIVAVLPSLRDDGPALEVFLRLRDEHLPEGITIEFHGRRTLPVDGGCGSTGIRRGTALTAHRAGGVRLPGRSLHWLSICQEPDARLISSGVVVECLDHSGVLPQQLCLKLREYGDDQH
jgi:hypothetical protein